MKKPLQNIIAVAGFDVVSRLLGFAANAYLARVLGASGFGVMSIGFSVLSYIAIISNPGLTVLGTRNVAAREESAERLPGSLAALRFVIATCCILLASAAAFVFSDQLNVSFTALLFSLSALPMAFSLDWYFQGKENLVASSGSKAVTALVYVVLVVALVHAESDVPLTAVAYFMGNIVASLLLLELLRRQQHQLRIDWRVKSWKNLLSASLPLGLTSFLAQTFMNLPVLIVGFISSAADAGLFNGAMKLVFVALMIDRVFYTFFFPVISRQRAADATAYKHTASLALRVVLAVGIPIVVYGTAFAEEAVRVVYGSGFVGAVVPFQILLLYFLFSIVNTVFMSVMIAENREREYVRIMAGATALLVILSLALASLYGATGVASAVAIGEGVLTFWLFVTQRARIFDISTLRLTMPAVASGLAMLAAVFLLSDVHFIAALAVGALTFSVMLVILKGFSKEEIQFLRERFV
ncbi:MAG: flippase [Ignavibacteriae bacterium]|nr:flippase [Ignavibacteriota bacterium]